MLSYFYPSVRDCLIDCIANCETCDSNVGCDVCQAGYCYDKTDEECLANSGYDCALCEKRDGDVSCLTCYDGTYLELCQGMLCTDAVFMNNKFSLMIYPIRITISHVTSLQHVMIVYV